MAFTNQTVPINEIMEYFYAVPDYQRGYVWDQERVSDFINSIIEHFEEEKVNNDLQIVNNDERELISNIIEDENIKNDLI